jgi:hypothetical protein
MPDQIYCPGGGKPPTETRGREMPNRSGEGTCPVCADWKRLTAGGVLRRHKTDADKAAPPQDGPKVVPESPRAGVKTNKTPDLDDEHYLEQVALIAQAVAVMPAQREGMPNVTVPPPIRIPWAKFLITLGLRIDPNLATHKLQSVGPAAAGSFGPRIQMPIRTSLKHDDMMKVWEQMDPESFRGIQSGAMTRESLLANMPEEMRNMVHMVEEMRKQEASTAQPPPKEAP